MCPLQYWKCGGILGNGKVHVQATRENSLQSKKILTRGVSFYLDGQLKIFKQEVGSYDITLDRSKTMISIKTVISCDYLGCASGFLKLSNMYFINLIVIYSGQENFGLVDTGGTRICQRDYRMKSFKREGDFCDVSLEGPEKISRINNIR